MIEIFLGDAVEGACKAAGMSIEKEAQRFQRAYFGAVYLLGCSIITMAVRRAPKDTGYMRGETRYVQKPAFTAYRFSMQIGFSAPYAEIVHRTHKTKARFLTSAVDDHKARAPTFVLRATMTLASNGQGIDDLPEPHPIGPLVGPHIHPHLRRRRAAAWKAEQKRAKEEARAARKRRS